MFAISPQRVAVISFGVLILSSLIGVGFAPNALAATPTVVQFASSSSATVKLPSPVTAGDYLIICSALVDSGKVAMGHTTVSDSLGSHIRNVANVAGNTRPAGGSPIYSADTKAWYAQVKTADTDKVTIKIQSGISPTPSIALYVWEVSGVSGTVSNSTGFAAASPESITTNPSATAYSPASGAVVAACGGFPNAGSVSAGTGYTLDHGFSYSGGEHLTGFSGTSTTSPFVTSTPTSHWSEVSIAII